MIFYDIFIQQTSSKGRGVFCNETIPQNATIETAAVIVMTAEERAYLDKTLLHDYIFEWQPEGKNLCCMALGNVPIYNHSYQSNCEYFMDYEAQTISIKTVREIETGEELTINYNGDWNDEKNVWFDVK
jgi:SET domain-containing protein